MLAFGADTWTTVLASAAGSEQNPLAPPPPSAAYLAFSALRALVALALVWAFLPRATDEPPPLRDRIGRVVIPALGALVSIKAAAALSNGWLLRTGEGLLPGQLTTPGAIAVWGGIAVGGALLGAAFLKGYLASSSRA